MVKIMDETSKITVQKALDLSEQGEYREAIELLYEVVDRYPNFSTGFELIGDFYLRNAQPDLAIRPLEMALEINQDSYASHFLLGCAYGRTLHFEEAIEELEIALEFKPEDGEVMRNIGWITCMGGNLNRGRDFLLKALELEPDNGLIYNDLAASYMFSNSRDLEKARYWLEKARTIEPDEPFIQLTYQSFLEMQQTMASVDSAF